MTVQLDELQWSFKALSCKKRLEILQLLFDNSSMTVGEISERLNSPVATISRNLAILSKAGFVVGEEKKTYTYYSIRRDNNPQNIALLALIKDAMRARKKSKTVEIVSAAMFEPSLIRYLEILSSTDYD